MTRRKVVQSTSESEQLAQPGNHFCCGGTLPVVSPQIEIEGFGRLRLPLGKAAARRLLQHCHVAPYGQGTETRVDQRVRRTWEIDAERLRVSDEWNDHIRDATRRVAAELGLPEDQLRAEPYKLLLYEPGGFFLPHRDSEKVDRMVASMVVVLPTAFQGGELVVRHHSAAKRTFTFSAAATGGTPAFAAFYADCEHEVHRVRSGFRICLTYNLLLAPSTEPASRRSRSVRRGSLRKPPSTSGAIAGDAVGSGSSEAVALAAPPPKPTPLEIAIRDWFDKHPTQPLVFALEHQYTQHGLSVDLLKGADRRLAGLLLPAATATDCHLLLTQVSRHLCQWADDGSFGRWESRSRRSERGSTSVESLELGEVYEDELFGEHWVGVDGETRPWKTLPLQLSSIVTSVPLEDWRPTSERFEGYTGNAGNTLDRWYHRSAIVLWPRPRQWEILCVGNWRDAAELFDGTVAKLAATPSTDRPPLHAECVRFGREIVRHWPVNYHGYWLDGFGKSANSWDEKCRDRILSLDDLDLVRRFLETVAARDSRLPLAAFVRHATRRFGPLAFAGELQLVLAEPRGKSAREGLAVRDAEWLAEYCGASPMPPEHRVVARTLCGRAVARMCSSNAASFDRYPMGAKHAPTPEEVALGPLLQALAATDCEAEWKRVLDYLDANPARFTLEGSIVPALRELVLWSRKRFGKVSPPIEAWLRATRERLRQATAAEPPPPSDFSRPAKLGCQCRLCQELGKFLADPLQPVGRIPSAEAGRDHLIHEIGRRGYDVTHRLEKKGSPYSLVLTKTEGSFNRAQLRYRLDRKLLASLPPDEPPRHRGGGSPREPTPS